MNRRPDIMAGLDGIKAAVSIAALIGETVPLGRDGQNMTGLCPFHGERTPSFRVYADHYHCFGCGAHGDAIDWLMATRRMTFADALAHLSGGIRQDRRNAPSPAPKPALPSRSATADAFMRLWQEGTDPAGTPVETYLRNRGGLSVPEGAPIRFHPRCQRGTRDLDGGPEHWPAMLALMTNPITGQPVGLHRTYLRPDGSGKAPDTARTDADGKPVVLTAKRILGTWGVIRLAEPEGEGLGLTEGVENALTAMQVIGWGPVWAAGCRGSVATFPVLPGHALSIFADSDAPGLEAARACAYRWKEACAEALIHVPPDGEDWNSAVLKAAA
jgi:DNA primase